MVSLRQGGGALRFCGSPGFNFLTSLTAELYGGLSQGLDGPPRNICVLRCSARQVSSG